MVSVAPAFARPPGAAQQEQPAPCFLPPERGALALRSLVAKAVRRPASMVDSRDIADIADILKLSVRTVNKHLETVFRKLGVENRSAATAIAMEQIREFV